MHGNGYYHQSVVSNPSKSKSTGMHVLVKMASVMDDPLVGCYLDDDGYACMRSAGMVDDGD